MSILRKAIAALLAVALLVPACADGIRYYPDADAAWYEQLLQNAQLATGSNVRLKKLIARAEAGEALTIAAIGGSITEGAGAKNYRECYACRFYEGFRSRYGADGGRHIAFVNAGVGGTNSPFGLLRYQRDILARVTDEDGLPDLVIIEFAVNDGGEPTGHQAYESMVRQILSQPNEPVVILLFSVFHGGYNLQDALRKIGDAVDVMMVSIRDAVWPEIGNHLTRAAFFSDDYHPTSLGHGIMADCLLSAVEAAAARAADERDVNLSSAPAYSADYMGLIPLYGSENHPEIGLNRGGFAHDDRRSYTNLPVGRTCGENFCHTATDSNEPLTFTATFRNLLIAWRQVAGDTYGRAEVRIDGAFAGLLGMKDASAWGQSVVSLIHKSAEAEEHTVEILMAEGYEDTWFTITCIGYTP